MGDVDRVIERGPDNGDRDKGDRDKGDRDNGDGADGDGADGRRPPVAALVAKLRDGVDELRSLPLEGVPPALGDRPWP